MHALRLPKLKIYEHICMLLDLQYIFNYSDQAKGRGRSLKSGTVCFYFYYFYYYF